MPGSTKKSSTKKSSTKNSSTKSLRNTNPESIKRTNPNSPNLLGTRRNLKVLSNEKKSRKSRKSKKSLMNKTAEELAGVETYRSLFILIKAAENEILSKTNVLVSTEKIRAMLGNNDATASINQFIENQVNARLIPSNYFEYWALLRANNYKMNNWNTYDFKNVKQVDELRKKYINYSYNLLMKYNDNIKRAIDHLNVNKVKVGGARLTPYFIIALLTFPVLSLSLNKTETSRVNKLMNDYAADKAAGRNCAAYENLEDVFPEANLSNNEIFVAMNEAYKGSISNDVCDVILKSLERTVGDDPRRSAGLISYPDVIFDSINAIAATTGMSVVSDALSDLLSNIYEFGDDDDGTKSISMGVTKQVFAKIIGAPIKKLANNVVECRDFMPQPTDGMFGWVYTGSSWSSLLWSSKIDMNELITRVDKAFNPSERRVRELLGKVDSQVLGQIINEASWGEYKAMRTQMISQTLFQLPRLQQAQLLSFLAEFEDDVLREIKLLHTDVGDNIASVIRSMKNRVTITGVRLNLAYDASIFALKEGGHLKDAVGKLANGDNKGASIAFGASSIGTFIAGVRDVATIVRMLSGGEATWLAG